MYEEIDLAEFQSLQAQVNYLSTELAVHKALILALMSELSSDKLTEFSKFRSVTHAELSKQQPHSDEEFHFRKLLNDYLNRAIYESNAQPDL